jgi:hypothetical protein
MSVALYRFFQVGRHSHWLAKPLRIEAYSFGASASDAHIGANAQTLSGHGLVSP